MRASVAGFVGAVLGASLASAAFVGARYLERSPQRPSAGAASAGDEQAAASSAGTSSTERRPSGSLLPAFLRFGSSNAMAAVDQERVHGLSTELDHTRNELADLRGQLRDSVDGDRRIRPYQLSQPQLAALAEKCALTWDMPSINDPAVMSDTDLKTLGLGDDERGVIDDILKDNDVAMRAQIHQVFLDITGDPTGAANLSPEAQWHEVEDKMPREVVRQVFQRLSQERAGLASPPSDLSSVSSFEQLYRAFTSAGDHTEQQIAAHLGEDVARRYRDKHNGFSSRYTSSYGCPATPAAPSPVAGAAQ